jgi:diketogulonate reductase-like aldo/keto reductase
MASNRQPEGKMGLSDLPLSRRSLLQGLAAWVVSSAVPVSASLPGQLPKRPVSAAGESIPILGMGTWLTFDVADYPTLIARRAQVMRAFLEGGGGMIDSSPMYGSSERAIGACLKLLPDHGALFTATKVWTPGRWLGVQQMESSMELWGVPAFDLMQIHNMLDWKRHLETLKAWKAQGRVRYIGITTSHGRRHEALQQALIQAPFDCVQLTYNILDREAETRLLPLAAERGIGVIVNRPFRRGGLFDAVAGKPLPAWAKDIGCSGWAGFFLKFILSHPAVTCAIPATTRVDHMQENLQAARGEMPDPSTRQRMVDYVERLVA